MEGSIARALLNERRAVEAEEKSPIFKNVVYAEDELMITIDESLKVTYELVCVSKITGEGKKVLSEESYEFCTV